MKKITLWVLLSVISVTQAQEIKWMSMNEALAAQAKNPKKIFVDVYTIWCGPCKMLDKNTFSNPDVASFVNKNFYAVKFNAEGDETISYQGKSYSNPGYDPSKAMKRNSSHQFSRFMGVNAYPTMLFIDETGNLINRVKGYRTPQQLELFLKLFGTNLWKDITTQEAYQDYVDNFKPEFKG
ncbi:MAG TPA: thioredoxin family protein [Flavobacteriaceae bacterium]|nr:thioredoxin family protein [Flavobacteriaceae bacterium]MCB9213948.1 thioredoxin family protein [Alteromonas sp.]HPF11067.1 thioredoxin family protein [Flavobacteriaceae bacterium]HQU22136.1 thioredoxin family protein [Flavobacteriaceae bacterium]HQU64294.1 thioredoxin family protein [Flavobacteriaceae bacterium]